MVLEGKPGNERQNIIVIQYPAAALGVQDHLFSSDFYTVYPVRTQISSLQVHKIPVKVYRPHSGAEYLKRESAWRPVGSAQVKGRTDHQAGSVVGFWPVLVIV